MSGTTNRLAPYEQHGVEVTGKRPDGQASGNCPWCRDRSDSNKKGKGTFFIRADGEVWDCKTCGRSGNLGTFFLHTFRNNVQKATIKLLNSLSLDRGGIEVRTFRSWGFGWNGKQFTYPAWVANDTKLVVSDIRLYRTGRRPVSSVASHAGLMMPVNRGEAQFLGSKTVWICEGEWDGMAWWEALRSQGINDDVVAVPGAGTFPPRCLPLFAGKDVILLYDNDTPGQIGQEKVWKKLQGSANTIRRLKWPEGLPDGFDVRDQYMELKNDGKAMVDRVKSLLTSEPYHTVAGGASSGSPESSNTIDENGAGLSPKEAIREYRKWLKLDQPDILDVVFGAVFANRMDIDPLWLFLVGPPGCGKSELLMSLSSAPLIHCSSGLTHHTLISGMNVGGKDPSLIPKLIGKTWVVKDFTTVLGLNQLARDEIFSVLRDAYDGRIERPFGNLMTPRRYEGRFGIIAGVTNKIDSVTAQNAILGERFIRWRQRHRGKVLVNADVIMQALDNLTGESQMRDDLREIGRKILDRPVTKDQYPTIPRWFKERIVELAQWVAVMRGVVERDRWSGSSGVITAKPAPEIGTRLAKQFCTLGMGIGVFRGVKELDEDIYRVVATVGRDTCPDRAEDIIKNLYIFGGEANVKSLSEATHFPHDTVRWVLQDLELLNVVRRKKGIDGIYSLTESVATVLKRLKLYDHDRAWRWAKKGEDE